MVHMLSGEFRVLPDAVALAHDATQEVLRAAAEAVEARGQCCIALSGGHTPEQMYRLWSTEYRGQLPWKHLHFFLGDERYVAHDDPLSNYSMIRESLLDHIPIPVANVHPIPTDSLHPEDAATEYEATLREYLPGEGPALDILLLGTGNEGHTASLFPGSAALGESRRWVVSPVVPPAPHQRITMTLQLLNRSANAFFLLSGGDKREILHKMRTDPDAAQHFPAAMIHPLGQLIWFLDRDAFTE
jgi:6-phosphogluconolactonase